VEHLVMATQVAQALDHPHAVAVVVVLVESVEMHLLVLAVMVASVQMVLAVVAVEALIQVLQVGVPLQMAELLLKITQVHLLIMPMPILVAVGLV
jgi:hypothetical protein